MKVKHKHSESVYLRQRQTVEKLTYVGLLIYCAMHYLWRVPVLA